MKEDSSSDIRKMRFQARSWYRQAVAYMAFLTGLCAVIILVLALITPSSGPPGPPGPPGPSGNGTDCVGCNESLRYMNGISGDSNQSFALQAGDNVVLTPLQHGLLINATATIIQNCTCAGNGTGGDGILTINSIFPDVSSNFIVSGGSGIGVIGVTNGVLISNTGVLFLNGLSPNVSGSVNVVGGSGILVTSAGSTVTVSTSLQQGLRFINGLPGNANNSFSVLAGPGIGVVSSGASVTISTTLQQGLRFINELPGDNNNSLSIVSGSASTLSINSSNNTITITNLLQQGLRYINGLPGNANNSFSVLAGTGVAVVSSGNSITISNLLVQGLRFINGMPGDFNNSISVLGGNGITVVSSNNSLVIATTLQQGLLYINGLSGNANNSFNVLAGSGIAVASSGSSVTISTTLQQGLRFINGLAGDANNSFSVLAGSGINVLSSGNSVTISSPLVQGLRFINGLPGDANNSLSVVSGGPGLSISSAGSTITITNLLQQGLRFVNGLVGDANNSISLLAGAGMTVTTNNSANTITVATTLQQGIRFINGLPGDGNNTFTFLAGANVVLTPLPNGLLINSSGAVGPQGEPGPPGQNGTCGCNGTGIFTINSIMPDGNANFGVNGGPGIAITGGTSLITVSNTGVLYLNGLPPNGNGSVSIVSGGPGLSVSSAGNTITITNLLTQGLRYINGLPGDSNNSFSVLAGDGISIASSGTSVTISTTLQQGLRFINGIPGDSNNSFNVLGDGTIVVDEGDNNSIVISTSLVQGIVTINGLSGDGGNDFSVFGNGAINVEAGDNHSIAISTTLMQGLMTINGIYGDENYDFMIVPENHIVITPFDTGINISTDGSPLNGDCNNLVARDENCDFEGHYIDAVWFRATYAGDESNLFVFTSAGNSPNRYFYSVRYDGVVSWGDGDSVTDTTLERVDVATLQVGDNLVQDGWHTIGQYLRVGSTATPLNANSGDLTAKRLLVYGTDSFYDQELPLGTGPGLPLVQFAATITDAAAGINACGFNSTYNIRPGGVSDGIFYGTALGQHMDSPGVDGNPLIAGLVGTLIGNQLSGSAPITDLVALWAQNRVIGNSPSSGGLIQQHVFLGGTGYTVGDLLGVVACGAGTGAQLQVISVNGGGAVNTVSVLRPGINYTEGSFCNVSGGTGTGMIFRVDGVGNTLYNLALGVRAQAYTAQSTWATPRFDKIVGVQVMPVDLGNSPVQYDSWSTQQLGLEVLDQAMGTTLNAGTYVHAFSGAAPNYGHYVEGFSGSALSNTGVYIGSMAGVGAAVRNTGMRIDPPATSGNATVSAALQLQADDSTASVGGILFGSGNLVPLTNLYRVSTTRLMTDAGLTAAGNVRAGTYASVGSTTAPLNTATGSLTAATAMLGTPEELLSDYSTVTLKLNGVLTSANSSSPVSASTCGMNGTMQIVPTGATTGAFVGYQMNTDVAGDNGTASGGVYSLRAQTRLTRPMSVGNVVGVRGLNQVTTNTPSTQGLLSVGVTAGGTGYTVGNQLTVTGGGGTGGIVVVSALGASNAVTAVTMLRPGSGYTAGTGRATTGGSGTGCTINILSVGATTYTTMHGGLFAAYSALNTYATPTITQLIGVAVESVDMGLASSVPTPTTQWGVVVQAQNAASTNYGVEIQASAAPTGSTNYGTYVRSLSATNGTCFALNVDMPSSSGTLATNVGLRVGPGSASANALSNTGILVPSLTSTGTATVNVAIDVGGPTGAAAQNIGLRITQPTGGTTRNQAIQLSTQGTTAAAGILFGSGADTFNANLYRVASGRLKTDAEMVANHVVVTGLASPTCTINTACAGTGATCTATGSDGAFTLQLVTGSAAISSNCNLFSVSYARAYTGTGAIPVFSPASFTTAGLAVNQKPSVTAYGLSSFVMYSGTSPMPTSSTQIWTFLVMGY